MIRILNTTVKLSTNAIILLIIERYFIMDVHMFKCKLSVIIIRFYLMLNFLQDFSKKN